MSPLAEELGVTDDDIKYYLESDLNRRVLELMTYGIYTSIFFISLFYIVSRSREKSNRILSGPAVLVTMIWVLATVHASAMWFLLFHTFITHGESRDSQILAVVANTELDTKSISMGIVTAVSSATLLVVADLIMIWRCWILYGHAWWIVVIPGLALLVGIAGRVLDCIDIYVARPVLVTSGEVNWRVVYLSTTVLTTVFCTFAIIIRIISISGLAKSLRTYRGILEILVESALLYTTVYLIEIGLEVHAQYFAGDSVIDERFLYAEGLLTAVTAIAPTLILGRVAAGHARPDDNWTRTSLPHIRTTMRSFGDSLRFASRSVRGNTTTQIDCESGLGRRTGGISVQLRDEGSGEVFKEMKDQGVEDKPET